MPLGFNIDPVDVSLTDNLQSRIDQKTKPRGSLGLLEKLALQIGLVQNSLTPQLNRPTLIVFAGDHGIVEAGVSIYPQTVTAQMVANFLAGGAAINVFAKQHALHLFIVDAGVNAQFDDHPMLIKAKIACGTRSFQKQPAMTNEQCLQAIQAGAEIVHKRYHNGCNCIGFGEMGIGNTSSAALLMHLATELPLSDCVGRGAGLNEEQMQQKISILQEVLNRHSFSKEPLKILAAFGGFELAMMMGAYLKAAELGMVIIVDGFITSSVLLVASKLYPNVLQYCFFSHVSSESGHKPLLEYMQAKPLLDLSLRLGEGSGIAIAYPLLKSAVLFLNDMATFEEANVDKRKQHL